MKLTGAARKARLAEFVRVMIATINRLYRNVTVVVQRIVHRIAMHQRLVPQQKRVLYFRIDVSFMWKIMKSHEDVYQVSAIKIVRMKTTVKYVPMINCVMGDRLVWNIVTHAIRLIIQIAKQNQRHICLFRAEMK